MKIVCFFLCKAIKRVWFWYVMFHRDGVPNILVGDRFSMHIIFHFVIISFFEDHYVSTIFDCWILASPMWCKPSLDDIWIGLYIEVLGLTVYPTWCVPSTDEVWVFWLSLELLSNGTVWFFMMNWYFLYNKCIYCWNLSRMVFSVIWGIGLELKFFESFAKQLGSFLYLVVMHFLIEVMKTNILILVGVLDKSICSLLHLNDMISELEMKNSVMLEMVSELEMKNIVMLWDVYWSVVLFL